MLKAIQKLSTNAINSEPATIAFLGDSITNGCFEVGVDENGFFKTKYDTKNSYTTYIKNILNTFYPQSHLNIINAGVNGDSSAWGYDRIDRDVLRYSPDLVVVCFGLNDCMNGEQGINDYAKTLGKIFDKLKDAGTEVIFMTPQPICDRVSHELTHQKLIDVARRLVKISQEGIFDKYMQAGVEMAKEKGVLVCDCYSKWMKLKENGVDITDLLSNKLNHPTREMQYLFAFYLIETMMEN